MDKVTQLVDELIKQARLYQQFGHLGVFGESETTVEIRLDEARTALLTAIDEAMCPTIAYEVVRDDGERYYHQALWLDEAAARAQVAELKTLDEEREESGSFRWDYDDETGDPCIRELPISYPEVSVTKCQCS